MYFEDIFHYSGNLQKDMNVKVYGHSGRPCIVFPCQDSMANNFEENHMIELLSDYIDNGQLQLFCVDSVDKESWSDTYGDKALRANRQEQYFNYIIEEVLPLVYEYNDTGMQPFTTGCSLGALHAAIVFMRRPDLFSGMLSMSGLYDATFFFDGWMNGVLYNNSPIHMLEGMPNDHWYVDLYKEKTIIVCIGQGRWEAGRPSNDRLNELFRYKGVNAWFDYWGYDCDHDWPWWKKQIRYFLPHLI